MTPDRRQPCTIRPARPDEAEHLGSLALRSKAAWGYSPELMDACSDELSYTPAQIESPTLRFAVAEVDGRVAGFYALERPAAPGSASRSPAASRAASCRSTRSG